jgi:hypothetical protein
MTATGSSPSPSSTTAPVPTGGNKRSSRLALKDRIMRVFIVVVTTTSVLFITYFSGQRANVGVAKRAQRERRAALDELTNERRKVAERTDLLRRWEARRQMHLALLALDERNFGIAQQHLRGASEQINASSPPSDLQTLARQIGDTSLIAAGNYGGQRLQVIELARRLDALLRPALEGAGLSPPPASNEPALGDSSPPSGEAAPTGTTGPRHAGRPALMGAPRPRLLHRPRWLPVSTPGRRLAAAAAPPPRRPRRAIESVH